MSTDRYEQQLRRTMSLGWTERDGEDVTACGPGSLLKNTAAIRDWLPRLMAERHWTTLLDAGAGDLNWITHITFDPPIVYRPYDLVPRGPDVLPADISYDPLPAADAILCRHVLNHLPPHRIELALENFRRSAPYLLATTFPKGVTELGLVSTSRHFIKYDLRAFGLGDSETFLDEGKDCGHLGLWRIAP